MNLEKYHYFTNNNYLSYEFYSEGPKGKIKKSIRFTQVTIDEPIIYNLAFGDIVETTGEIDDKIVTNNSDRNIVLATIAATIWDFSKKYKNYFVFAKGSTPARTRLYQMGISALLEDITKDFILYGFRNDEWSEFQINTNYDAFLVKRK